MTFDCTLVQMLGLLIATFTLGFVVGGTVSAIAENAVVKHAEDDLE